jgi:hypothetical protein
VSLTDDEVAALSDPVPVPAAAPRPRAARAGAPKTTKQVPVNIPEAEIQKAGEQVARMNKITDALGIDLDADGSVLLDNANSRTLHEGIDPEVFQAAAVKRFVANRKRGEKGGGEGHMSVFGGKAEPEDVGFESDFGPSMLGFKPADTKRQAEAARVWELIGHLIGDEENKRGEDPTLYLYSKHAGKASKDAARARLAARFYQAAQTLPPVGNAPELAAKWRRLGDYVRTLDPAMLHGAHQSMGHVKELADKHASPPVAAAVEHAIQEQSDPERSSSIGSFATAFLNNVAPMTVAGGSAIAQPLGSGRTTGEGTSYIRQRLLQDLGGLPPEQQAEAIERFKAEHPGAYAAGAVSGWLADPVGLLGGKAFQAIKAARAAAGAGTVAANVVPAVAVGAPSGVLYGRSQGSDNDAANAAAGVAGELGGVAAGKVLGKVAQVVGGAPARVAAREAKAAAADAVEVAAERATEARKIYAEVAREAHRQGHDVPRPLLFKRVMERLEEKYPGLPKNQPRRDLDTGKMLPSINAELGAAVDDALASSPFGKAHGAPVHGAQPGPGAVAAHPYAALANPTSSAAAKAAAVAHGIGEGRSPITMGMLYASANAAKGGAKLDYGMAQLVTAIRSGSREKFAQAIKDAIHDGVPSATIDAATELMERRHKMQQEAGQ